MSLSNEEIDRLIMKLRQRYKEYSEKYNPVWFNIEAFEQRYIMALENKMNLEGFILAEISNFEKVKEKYDKKVKRRNFSEKVDNMIKENLGRILKYPKIKFHPSADLEMCHFYGAIQEFTLYIFSILWIIIKDPKIKSRVDDFEYKLTELSIPKGKSPAKRINDHLLLLSRKDVKEIEIERDKNEYLKESAFILHQIIDFCDELIREKEPQWEMPLKFDGLYIEDKRKKRTIKEFSELTGYGAILKVKESALNIIEDFRLKAFKSSS